MVQLTYLITFICLLIALALFAGAFYLAKYVVSLQHRTNVLEDSYKAAEEHIQKQEEIITQLQQELDYARHEMQLAEQRGTRPRAWDPSNPLNTMERVR